MSSCLPTTTSTISADNETIERNSGGLAPVRPSPTILVPPTSNSSRTLAARASQAPRRASVAIDPIQRRRMRVIVAVSGLVGLALISFLVALAAKGARASRSPTTAPTGVPIVVPIHVDATIVQAAPPDAYVADAADAAVAVPDASAEAFLEVSTFPPGGTVRVGDQSRVAPAQLVVEAGAIGVDAELDGYAPVHRNETVEAGEHRTVEIAFTHKLPAPHGPALGRLTVRTSPYAEVYENGKKIGETPFADRELSAGAHVLTFKNPLHPTITKKIVITAGKVAKLSFDLP